MLVMLFKFLNNRQVNYNEVRRSNTDSAIAALYILLDSSEDAFCSVNSLLV